MKRCFTLFVFLIISSAIYTQDYKKQIEELDTAYAHGDYLLAKKIIDLRIFSDENDKMNLSLRDIGGEALIISQFTLCTDNGKSGNRPSFINAELPERAEKLYILHIEEMKLSYDSKKIKNGAFGENMQIKLCNDGPVTIILQRNLNT